MAGYSAVKPGSQAIKYLFSDYSWDYDYRPGLEAVFKY